MRFGRNGSPVRGKRTLDVLAVGASLIVSACLIDAPTVPDVTEGEASVQFNVSAAPGLETIVVEVTALDLSTPAVFNLTLVEGRASGTIRAPAGHDRTITARGFGKGGVETHRGSVVTTLQAGSNPGITLTMEPLTGEAPIVAVVGDVRIDLNGLHEQWVGVDEREALSAVVVDSAGTVLDVAVEWGSSDPEVARIEGDGFLRGVSEGGATLYATIGGIAVSLSARVVGAVDIAPDTTRVAVGPSHACALDSAGQAFCWGSGRYGERGDGQADTTSVPGPVGSQLRFRSISAGYYHTCAVTDEGQAYCWGRNRFGEVGDGLSEVRFTPVPVNTELRFAAIVAGGYQSCGLTNEGRAYCWGYGRRGQLGTGLLQDMTVPTPTAGGVRFKALSQFSYKTCGLSVDDQVFCWGYAYAGELGPLVAPGTFAVVPTPVPLPVPARDVSMGVYHACALGIDRIAYCWGRNNFGELGDEGAARSEPRAVASGVPWERVHAGFYYSCAVRVGGGVDCWGWNRFGALGDGTAYDRANPAPASGAEAFTSLTRGYYGPCGLGPGSGLHCWGRNLLGVLGQGDDVSGGPIDVSSGLGLTQLAARPNTYSCAIDEAGSVLCAGEGTNGQLGTGQTSSDGEWQAVSLEGAFTSVSSANGHSCALRTDGRVWCWGDNQHGALGGGAPGSDTAPIEVRGGLHFTAISVGGSVGSARSCGITADAQAFCWGYADYWGGALGDGGYASSPIPVRVTGADQFRSIDAGQSHSCAIDGEGRALCWGRNRDGQLGRGTTEEPLWRPDSVQTEVRFTSVSVGSSHSCALADSGRAYCWGRNGSGELGTGDTQASWVPVEVAGGQLFSKLEAVQNRVCALALTGTLYCWGYSNATSPQPVLPDLTFSDFSLAQGRTCGRTIDGTTFCWGENNYGQFGVGGPVRRPSPVVGNLVVRPW